MEEDDDLPEVEGEEIPSELTRRVRYYENEGAIFRGFARAWPQEVWSDRQREWLPYEGRVPKPVDWGSEISEEEALSWTDNYRP